MMKKKNQKIMNSRQTLQKDNYFIFRSTKSTKPFPLDDTEVFDVLLANKVIKKKRIPESRLLSLGTSKIMKNYRYQDLDISSNHTYESQWIQMIEGVLEAENSLKIQNIGYFEFFKISKYEQEYPPYKLHIDQQITNEAIHDIYTKTKIDLQCDTVRLEGCHCIDSFNFDWDLQNVNEMEIDVILREFAPNEYSKHVDVKDDEEYGTKMLKIIPLSI